MSNILQIPFKKTDSVDLRTIVLNHISEHYDQHPSLFQDDCLKLNSLRQDITKLTGRSSDETKLVAYYKQLAYLSCKVPQDIGAEIIWYNSLTTINQTSSNSCNNLKLEQLNVLYNIGALYSQLGYTEDRVSSDGLKRAFQKFQLAAGTFQHLNTLVNEISVHELPPEMSHNFLATFQSLMLGQAQECVWQRAVLDHLKDISISRLAMQVSKYYLSAAATGESCEDIPQDWVNHTAAKGLHFEAASEWRLACDRLSSSRYGEEIARLKAAQDCCTSALHILNINTHVKEDLEGLQRAIETTLARAEKDNDMIYLQRVPSRSQLQEIKPSNMVSPKLPESLTTVDITEKYLFQHLIPYTVHLSVNMYKKRKQQFFKDHVQTKIQSLEKSISDLLQRLGLPGSVEAAAMPEGLPRLLIAHSDEVRSAGSIEILQKIQKEYAEQGRCAKEVFDAAVKLVEASRKKQSELKTRYGASWTLTSWEEELAGIMKEKEVLSNYIQASQNSDDHVSQKMREWSGSIQLLASGEGSIDTYIPRALDAPSLYSSGQAIGELKSVLRDISRTRLRRKLKMEEFEQRITRDDILPVLLKLVDVAHTSESVVTMDAFEEKIIQHIGTEAMYKEAKNFVKSEADAQEDLVDNVTRANQAFLASRTFNSSSKLREERIQRLELAYSMFHEIGSNLEEGRKFYDELAAGADEYLHRCKVFVAQHEKDAAILEQSLEGELQRLENSLKTQGPEGVWKPARGIKFG